MKRPAHTTTRSLPWKLALGALLAGAPAFGQCLDVELGPEPSFMVPAHLQMTQSASAAQVAPLGSPVGEIELFRLWEVPAVVEVLRVSATGTVTLVQVVRLRSLASSPAVTHAYELAVDGDRLVVSTRDQVQTNAVDQGKVLVYHRSAGQWTFEQLLIPTGSPAQFGSSLALQGDRIVAGDLLAGTVHVFDRAGASWHERALVTDPSVGSLALDGDRFAVGRPKEPSFLFHPGARVYDRDAAGNWSRVASFTKPLGAHSLSFGVGLALQGDTVMLGDRSFTASGPPRGAVTIYSRLATGWDEVGLLEASPDHSFFFGDTITLDGADLVVGASYKGLVRYRFTGGTWVHEATFGETSRVDASDGISIVGDHIVTAMGTGGVQVVPWSPRGQIEASCGAFLNSSGGGVELIALATPSATGAPFAFYVQYMTGRPGANGLFFVGTSAVQLPMGGGELCVGGIVRLGPAGPPSSAFGWETIPWELDPALYPGLVQPGATLHFQYWYPDPLGPPRGNLSNSLVVTFCP